MIRWSSLILCCLWGLVDIAAAADRPNIVFILADDLGYTDVGWHQSQIQTPHLDALAVQGVRLEQFYVQPVCSPTRAALMTGRYPMRHGLQVGVVRPWAQYGLPLEERTLPHALAEAGYETAIVGKWHLGHFRPEYLPMSRGFTHQYGHYNGAIDYWTHVRDGGFDWHRDQKECRDEGYSTVLLGTEAVRLIREHQQAKPLFLYIPFNAPHSPLQVPEEFLERYAHLTSKNRRTYAAMVSCLDDQVGRIVAALDEAGMRQNTLIIFSSDNGGPLGSGATNGELRDGKGSVYEGGVRVPAFAVLPGRVPAGIAVHEPLHMVDWYPTLLRLAGAPLEQELALDGHDLWPVLTQGQPTPHQEILHNTAPLGGAIRRGDWKLVIHEGRRKNQSGSSLELFHIPKDIRESNNLAEQEPERVASLLARYRELAAEALPPKATDSSPKGFQAPRVWGESPRESTP